MATVVEDLTFEATAAKPKSRSLIETTRRDLETRVKRLRGELEAAEADLAVLASVKAGDPLTYDVYMSSVYTQFDEKSVSYTGTGSLKEVIKAAADKFKRVNRRSDVSASFSVSIVLPSGTHVSVPESQWGKFAKKFGKSNSDELRTVRKAILESVARGPRKLATVKQAAVRAMTGIDRDLVDIDQEIDLLLEKRMIGWTGDDKLALSNEGENALDEARQPSGYRLGYLYSDRKK